jgi:hypothetical protein
LDRGFSHFYKEYDTIGKTLFEGVNKMSMYEEYTLRDGTKKIIKKVEGRSLQQEMKLLGISEKDILSIQLVTKPSSK